MKIARARSAEQSGAACGRIFLTKASLYAKEIIKRKTGTSFYNLSMKISGKNAKMLIALLNRAIFSW